MEIQEKPDYLIFADSAKSGEISDFPDVERGWGITLEQTQAKPPLEWMNSAFNRIDKNTLYLLQQGVPEWSDSVLYPIGAIIKISGNLYKATRQNTNLSPDNSPNDWAPFIEDGSLTKKGIVKLSSAVNSKAENQAATPKAVKTAYDLANAALPKDGGTLSGDLTAGNITAKTSLTVGSAKATYSDAGLNIDKALLIGGVSALKVGDGGILSAGQLLNSLDDANFVSGFFITTSSTGGIFPTAETTKEGSCILVKRSNGKGSQLYLSSVTNKIYFRGFQDSKFSTWQELITTDNVASYTSNGLGYDQIWQDVLKERALGIEYTNTTGKPIEIKITCMLYGSKADVSLLINGVSVEYHVCSTNLSTCMTSVIPNNATYKISGRNPSLTKWFELR